MVHKDICNRSQLPVFRSPTGRGLQHGPNIAGGRNGQITVLWIENQDLRLDTMYEEGTDNSEQ